MAKRRINSSRKGKTGERSWANFLIAHGVHARRGVQFAGGPDSPDVVSEWEWAHFEVKRVERFSLYKSLDQAIGDARDDRVPIVAHRANGREWVVVLRAEDFVDLVRGGVG